MDPKADPSSDDYQKVRSVINKAIADLKRLGAEIVDPVVIPDLKDRVKRMYDDNVFETEQATNKYLAEHANAPAKTLREILLTGKVVPWRARLLLDTVGQSTDQPGYLKVLAAKEETRQLVRKIMADDRLDVLVYATFDHQPTLIAPDVLTNPDTKDEVGRGNNRYLSPGIAFPALTVPAGFTTDGLPVGIEFMGRTFAEPTLFRLGYAYEQGARNRKPPASTPAVPASRDPTRSPRSFRERVRARSRSPQCDVPKGATDLSGSARCARSRASKAVTSSPVRAAPHGGPPTGV